MLCRSRNSRVGSSRASFGSAGEIRFADECRGLCGGGGGGGGGGDGDGGSVGVSVSVSVSVGVGVGVRVRVRVRVGVGVGVGVSTSSHCVGGCCRGLLGAWGCSSR